jgi:RNA polymerase sigma-70 factor, ECF subfamily
VAPSETGVARWLAAARAGSKEALGQLFEACRGYLLLIARQELDADLQAKGSASDLLQETFLEAQRDFAAFRGQSEEALLGWLRQLLLNNVHDFRRRYQTAGKRQTVREMSLDAAGAAGQLRVLSSADSSSPSAKAMRSEKAASVREALARLPEDYRRVLLLRYQEEKSFEEIGVAMQRSANAARKLWLRALERIEQELETSP